MIEGAITGESNKPVEIPRLRFSVRDAQGAEIYAWNAVLEQSVLRPGERAQFKSRLASPPPEGRNIDVRFFNKRDLGSAAIDPRAAALQIAFANQGYLYVTRTDRRR